MFTEDMEPKRLPRSGFAKDSVEVEGYVRGFSRRRPDVAVTTLRFANCLGPGIETPLSAYFELPVIPTVLGFDPRLQFVHEDDLLDALRHAHGHRPPGDLQRRRRRRDPALPGGPPRRPSDAAAARAVRRHDRRARSAAPGRSTSRPSRSLPRPTVAGSTPRGMRSVLGFEPRYTHAGDLRRLRRARTGSTAGCPRTGSRPSSSSCCPSSAPGAAMSDARVIPLDGQTPRERAAKPRTVPRPQPAPVEDDVTEAPSEPGSDADGADAPETSAAGASAASSLDAKLAGALAFLRRGSPATTRSTTSATTPSSPTTSCSPAAPALQALVPRRDPRHRERPDRGRRAHRRPTTPGRSRSTR